MKKAISFILLCLLLISAIPASAESYADKSNEELYALLGDIQRELYDRSAALDASRVLYDEGGITISIERTEYKTNELYVYLRVVNNTEESVDVSPAHISVNGWAVNTSKSSNLTKPGERRKDGYIRTGNLTTSAEITDPAQIVDVKISLLISVGSSYIRVDPIPCIYTVESGLIVIPQE